MGVSEPTAGPRSRKQHTRSRKGCLTCRHRHKRCDEARPVCLNCTKSNQECEYPALNVPLRERKQLSLPGQLRPWDLRSAQPAPFSILVDVNPVDPFNCLPVKMPYKSNQLLHYFKQMDGDFDNDTCPRAKQAGILPFAMKTTSGLRDTLLVAALHYTWKSGDTTTFQATALFHKTEAIRSLNTQLESPRLINIGLLIKHIATLCFLECAAGNIEIAELHLNGLMSAMDEYSPLDCVHILPMSFNEEVSYRYLILAYDYIQSIKSRIHETDVVEAMLNHSKPPLPDFATLIFSWFSKDAASVQSQLKAMALFPFFFASLPPQAHLRTIDTLPITFHLKSLSHDVESMYKKDGDDDSSWSRLQGSIERSLTGLHFAIANSHVVSLTELQNPDKVFRFTFSSWCAITITSGLYLNSVLGFRNAGKPIEWRLFRRVITTLARDLAHSDYDSTNDDALNLWLWKHFVAAYSLAIYIDHTGDDELGVIENYFFAAIRRWSKCAGVTSWGECQRRLFSVAWSTRVSQTRAAGVWDKAVFGKLKR